MKTSLIRVTTISLTLKGVKDDDQAHGIMMPIVIHRTFIVEDKNGFSPEEAEEYFKTIKDNFKKMIGE